LAFTKSQMELATGKILGLFAYSALLDAIKVNRTKDNPNRSVPTLKEMSAKAIEVLSKNDKGFFLMIEAGRIDWAGHYNDTGTMLHEMLIFNEVLNYVLDWAKNRDDTLIVVSPTTKQEDLVLVTQRLICLKPGICRVRCFRAENLNQISTSVILKF